MGLFSKTKKVAAPVLAELEERHYEAQMLVKLAGLQHYQDTLRLIVAGLPKEMRHIGWAKVEAVITPEPDNAFDPDALKVQIADHTIGYIAKDHIDDYAIPDGFDGWMIGAMLSFARDNPDTNVRVDLMAVPSVTYE
jgi:hypothetical protein